MHKRSATPFIDNLSCQSLSTYEQEALKQHAAAKTKLSQFSPCATLTELQSSQSWLNCQALQITLTGMP